MKRILSFVLVFALFAGMLPQISFEAAAATGSVTYTFTYTGRSDAGRATTLEAANGTWNSVYKEFPTNPQHAGENWAYLGCGVGRAVSPRSVYVQIGRYVGTNRYYSDEWTAFKIKVPENGKYKLTAATGFAYSNGSQDLGIYLVPLDETYSAIFSEGNTSTYGTVPDNEFREGHKTFSQLGIAESSKIGYTTDLRASSATYDVSLSLTDTAERSLEAGEEYALILRTTTAGAQTISSLTFSYEIDEDKLTAIEASFGDEVIVGSKLVPEVVWKSGDKTMTIAGDVALEILEDNNVLIDAGNGDIYAGAAGVAKVKVTGTLDGASASTEVLVNVAEGVAYSGVDQQYLFYLNAHTGLSSVGFTADEVNEETFTNGCAVLEYGEDRPWAFVSAKASRPDARGAYFTLYAKYLDLSGRIDEWAAFKVKVPAAGKYLVDVGGYVYASGGKADVYMLPYDDSMTFTGIYENIETYISEENFVASADFNGSANNSVVHEAVGEFVADESLDYSSGYAEYLMIVTTNRSEINSSAYCVLLNSVRLIGSGGIDEVDVAMSDTEIGVGEETFIEEVTATYPGGGEIDLSGAFVKHSVAEEDSAVLEISDDGKSFKALSEGTATIKTLVLIEGSVATKETEITVDNNAAVMNAFLYGEDTASVGDELSFMTRVELNNRKTVDIGEVTKYEIVSESETGVMALSADGKTVTAKRAGTAKVRAEISVRGKLLYTDEITVEVSEKGISYDVYPTDFSIDLRQGTYSGDSFTKLPEITEYTEHRNWIYHDFVNPNPQYQVINLPAKTAKYSYIIWSSATAGGYIAFKVIFPEIGKYTAESYGFCRDRTPNLEMYVIPATEENSTNLSSLLVKDNEFYAGSADHYRSSAIYFETNAFNGVADITAPGEYFVVFKCVPGKAYELNPGQGEAWYNLSVNFKNTSAVSSAKLVADKEKIGVGEEIALDVELFDADDNKLDIDPERISATYISGDETIATVDESGRVTGISDGTTVISAEVSFGKVTVDATFEIRVEDMSGIDPEVGIKASTDKNEIYAYETAKLSLYATMNSGATALIPQEYITWEIADGEECAELSEDGLLTGLSVGTVVVKAKVSSSYKDGVEDISIEPIEIRVTWDATINPAIYTLEERENVKNNAGKYSWARDMVNNAKKSADEYLDDVDRLYNMMVPEGVPRYYHVGHKYDPKKFYCRYCGQELSEKYGSYFWITKPLVNEWKVECPECNRRFPSNDFASFYELGKTESGTYWSYEQALAEHHKLFVCEDGENCTCTDAPHPTNERMSEEWKAYYGFGIGYLANDLYKEMDEKLGVVGWGVDDSRGYMQPYIEDKSLPGYDPRYYNKDGYAWYKDGTTEGPVQHTYIAYYAHEGIWYGHQTTGIIQAALNSFTKAFVYTGEAKYGRAGAILLDKVADIYPYYDWYQWADFRGDKYRGKIVDPVSSTGFSRGFSNAYDAFLPIYNDPYVVEYLSEKGAMYEINEDGNWKLDGSGNPIPVNLKDSPGTLRKNVEDNILLQIFDDVKRGKLWGNFGMHHAAVANAAVALNRAPESIEMLKWLNEYGAGYNTGAEAAELISGGYMPQHFVEEVDRDGNGNENSPNYNSGWLANLIYMAELLADYELYPEADLFNNPKFVKMFYAQVPLTLGGYYTAQTGDSGWTASTDLKFYIDYAIFAFNQLGDRKLAQAIYFANGKTTDGLHGSIYDADAEAVIRDVEDVVEEYGELALESEMLTGYGFSVLRAGKAYDSVTSATSSNTIRDMAMYFGGNTAHGHYDALNLYMSAFGLNIAPDLGYPEQTGSQPNRMEWVRTTLSHNTVVVNEKEQRSNDYVGTPHHFDDSERVKLMDISADAYEETEEYRRTVFMVDVDDEISYGVDFFHIKGGDDHLYSFHSQSDEISAVSGLSDVSGWSTYEAEDGSLVGTYAGADVTYGADPGGLSNGKYPRGYTWLKNVRTYESIDNDFSVEFKVKDWNKVLTEKRDIRLRLTMLGDAAAAEVSFVTALPPQKQENKNIGELEYLLVRKEGKDLDTLFTTVLEPYDASDKYITGIEKVSMVRDVASKPGLNDAYGAVKVTLENRTDYIIYSTNTTVEYVIDDKIVFSGFGGVISLDNEGNVVYKYLNDGEKLGLIGESEAEYTASYSGSVKEFTSELDDENYIIWTPDEAQSVDTSILAGKYVYVENDGVQNAVYNIKSAYENDDGDIVLDIGDVTLIRSFVSGSKPELGYIYDISKGQAISIPLNAEYDSTPVLQEVSDLTAKVGSNITIPISVESPDGKAIELIGTSIPRGMIIDEENGVLTWKPTASQIGENHIAITASDGTLETTIHFTITVYGATTGGTGGGGSGATAPSNPTPDTGSDDDDEDSSTTTPDEGSATTPEGGNGADAENVRFIDLGNHAWAADSINSLADDGIVKGTTTNTYSPANNITRADFAILLVRAFELESDNAENFDDVSDSDYFAAELAIARNTGIVNGIGNNKYAPRNTITRQDMMLILYRALVNLGVEFEIAEIDYPDVTDISDYAEEAVKALVSAGLVNGKSGRLAPKDYTTRAEVAVLLKRILEYIKK